MQPNRTERNGARLRKKTLAQYRAAAGDCSPVRASRWTTGLPASPIRPLIENRAGASGTIAADVVAKAPADGYTFLVGRITVLEHVKAGKIRALAISTPQRLPQLPEVPTFEEKGIKGFDVTNWYSIMGPKGLPREVVAKVDEAVRKAMQDPTVRSTLEAQGVQFGGARTPDEFSTFLKAELAKYAKLVKDLGVTAQ
jgi:tripartite-type tricarboxylate transporter receptor subunit TctC